MPDLVPPEQPFLGDNNGCLTQLLNLFGDIAIIVAMGLYVPSARTTKQHQEQKQQVESVEQDVTDNNTNPNQTYTDTLATLERIRSDSIAKVK